MAKPYSDAQLRRATRAVHDVTGGGIPFGRKRKKHRVFVSAELVALAALDAATTQTVTQPLGEEAPDAS